MEDLNILKADQVYGAIVRHVLPNWSLGLFAAVLMGSILSSFNSALNSASTLFSLQFYKGYINKSASGELIVVVGKRFGVFLALASIIIAPFLSQMQSIFTYLQQVNGLYSVPIIGIFLIGILTKRVPAIAAKIGMLVGISMYAFFTFINIKNVPNYLSNGNGELHYLHGYFISFVFSVFIMLLIGLIKPKSDSDIKKSEIKSKSPVDMTPWPFAKTASTAIISTTALIYIMLSLISL